MRSDLLSKRVFYAGCFGLPWLWTVHALYHWKNASAFSDNVIDDEALLNPDDRKCRLIYLKHFLVSHETVRVDSISHVCRSFLYLQISLMTMMKAD